jgi:hypothetical protein
MLWGQGPHLTWKKIQQVKKTWARSNVEKAHAFTEHLAEVFQLHPSENELEEDKALHHYKYS